MVVLWMHRDREWCFGVTVVEYKKLPKRYVSLQGRQAFVQVVISAARVIQTLTRHYLGRGFAS
jgi:hypothetical protein